MNCRKQLSIASSFLLFTWIGIVGQIQAQGIPASTQTAQPSSADSGIIPGVDSEDPTVYCNHTLPRGTIAPVLPDVRVRNAVTEGNILLFAKGTKPKIDFPVQNDRTSDIAADYTVDLVTHSGTQVRQATGSLSLTGTSATSIHYQLETSDLKYGVYSLIVKLTAAGQPLADREYYLGIISDKVIPKSPDGAFLYGLDPNFGGLMARPPIPASPGRRLIQGQCDLFAWVDAMGVDIVRGGGPSFTLSCTVVPSRLNWITEDLPALRQHHLRASGFAEPLMGDLKNPKVLSPETIQTWTKLLADNVPKTSDVVTYWELGNEPDLAGGRPDVPRYVQGFEITSQAIKQANPKAIIMNGGLSFAHGDVGLKNSKAIIEAIKPELIDVIAYHAHGPGGIYERRIYEIARKDADDCGKKDKPLADTETGMFVGNKRQEDTQANMVVQKQVYGQSVGDKFLMTFRLHAFRSERGWGLLRSDQEPQPAILAYRTMTEHLKGLNYQKTLELGKQYAEGYTFAQSAGPARACVLWSNEPAFYNVYLKVAASLSKAENVRIMDIYGNESPADINEDGVARVEVTETPVYLLWNAVDQTEQVSVMKSMLKTPDMATVVPNGTYPLPIQIENSTHADIQATLSATINIPNQDATVTPDKQTLTIPALKTIPVELSVKCTPQKELVWPDSWVVYTNMKESDVNLDTLNAVPDTLNGVAGRKVTPTVDGVQMLPPGETPREKNLGYGFGVIHSDRDQTIKVGCSADWWMEFRLNGAVVCSTLKEGNKFLSPVDRVVDLPLKRGDNFVAFKILGGKNGMNFNLVSPSELHSLQDPRAINNCIELALESDGKTLAKERVSVQQVTNVRDIGSLQWTDPVEKWTALNPDFTLDSSNVTNLYEKEQDRTKWWQGVNDLSATAWLRSDSKKLYLMVWVQDDKDVTGTDPAKMTESDSLQVGMTAEAKLADPKPTWDLYDIGRISGKTAVYKETSAQGLPQGGVDPAATEIQAQVERSGNGTLYRVALDRSQVGDGIFRLNFLVNDNDDGYRKQYIQWTKGLGESQDPTLWQQFILTSPQK